jgi:hypothetical protein
MKRFRFMLEDIRGFFADIVPKTTGFQIQRWDEFFVSSHFNWLGLVLYIIGGAVFLRLLWSGYKNRRLLWQRLSEPDLQFGFYLMFVGVVNFWAYVILSPPADEIRYTYDLLLGMVGLYILLLQLVKNRRIRMLATVVVVGVTLNNIYAVGLAWKDFRNLNQEAPSQQLMTYLHEHDIRSGIAGDYESFYNLSFLSDETVMMTLGPDNGAFYPPYADVFRSTPAVNRALIRRSPCEGGRQVARWYVCPLPS